MESRSTDKLEVIERIIKEINVSLGQGGSNLKNLESISITWETFTMFGGGSVVVPNLSIKFKQVEQEVKGEVC